MFCRPTRFRWLSDGIPTGGSPRRHSERLIPDNLSELEDAIHVLKEHPCGVSGRHIGEAYAEPKGEGGHKCSECLCILETQSRLALMPKSPLIVSSSSPSTSVGLVGPVSVDAVLTRVTSRCRT